MEQYKSLKRFEELDVNKLRMIYGEIRKNVIEPITIRRTRTDLENIYENAETVSKSLAFIMKTQLVKRLESSFYAFKKSLTNFQKATNRMIAMFANDKIFISTGHQY